VASRLRDLARHSVVRFVLAGGLSFIADAGCLWALHGLLHLWLPAATALAYGAAFVVNFGLNRRWAFAGQGSGGGRMGRQLRRYLLLVGANLVLTVAGVQGLTWLGLPYLGSKVITAAVLAVLNYVASRYWIFLRAPEKAVPA
jgi:putative flippase GtrA